MRASSHSDTAAGGAGGAGAPGWRVFVSGRMAILAGLGVASGLPLMLTSDTLKVWAASQGLDVKSVGLFSLVTLPYGFKFLWAPLADRYCPPLLGPLGRRRAWLVVTQLLLVAGIVGMAVVGPRHAGASLHLMALAAVTVAVFSASQDIVADAYRTDVLRPEELSAGAAVFTGAFRLAMLAAGAGAACLVDKPFNLTWRSVYLLMAVLMGLFAISTLLAPRPASDDLPPGTLTEATVEPARAFLRRYRYHALTILLFVFLFKWPDFMAKSVFANMLKDLRFSSRQIGLLLGLGGVVIIPGALAGGWLLEKIRLVLALLVFALAHSLSSLGYLVLVLVGHRLPFAIAAVVTEYFCMGMAAAGLMAFLMSLCDKRYSATQFALLSGLMALGYSLAGAAAGVLAQTVGYPRFFGICMLSGLPGVALLAFLPAALTGAATASEPAPVASPTPKEQEGLASDK